MVTYTTAALVKKRIEHIDASLADADIEQYIYEAETTLNCIMKDSLVATFDATKHAILRSAASDIAAMSCIRFNPSEFPSAEEAEITANLLQENIQLVFYMLGDPRVVQYLKSL